MRLSIPILFIFFLLFTTCSPYVFLYEVEANDLKLDNELYVYSNDTIQIIYSFWANNGEMAFLISNISDKPIYVDWKKSTFIKNSTKFEYWEDIEIRKTNGKMIGSSSNLFIPFRSISKGVYSLNTTEIVSKQERITFLPPETNLLRNEYSILEQNILLNKEKMIVIEKKDTRYKKADVLFEDFLLDDSPLIFRNFITFSFDENFNEEFHIDNKFYISKITAMKVREFRSKQKYDFEKEEFNVDYYYKKFKDFYKE